MGWPSRQEYQEAFQAPDIAFCDADLKTANPELDPLRLPRVRSGNRAVVFRMQSPSKTWAVKCFTSPPPADQQQRYTAISIHVNRVALPYTVGFEFVPRGINVRGSWYPILKMEWVEGEPFKTYLERNLRDPRALRDLAQRFLGMIRALQTAGIGHGDLQHGNLIVCGQDLRLVDYDGMFVPALAGLRSAELGHENYQHPNRSATDFNHTLDNFSAWVVVLSLHALSVTPDLWDSTGKLGECLVFRKDDFIAPHASQVVQALARSPDATLQLHTLRFQALLYSEPAEVHLPEVRRVQAPAPVGSGWIDDHSTAAPPPGVSPSPLAVGSHGADSSWVLGWIKKPAHSAVLRNSVVPERVTVFGSLISGATLILVQDVVFVDAYLLACLLILLLVNFAILKKRYEAEPEVGRLKELSEQETVIGRQLRVRMHTIEVAATEKAHRAGRGADEVARLQNQETVLRSREMVEVRQAYVTRDKRLQELASKRASLDLTEAQDLSRARQPIQARLQSLDQRLTGLRAAEADELSKALKDLQAHHVLNYLRGHSIELAMVSGVGETLKERLVLAGFRSAADIDYYRVMGVERIGPHLASALGAWRKDLERASASTLPRALPRGDEAAIKSRYVAQVQTATAEKTREAAELSRQEQAVRAKYASLRADVPKEEDAARKAADVNARSTRGLYASQHSRLAETIRGIEATTAERIKEAEGRLVKLRKDLASLQWRKEVLRLEMDQMAGVTFSGYLQRVFMRA